MVSKIRHTSDFCIFETGFNKVQVTSPRLWIKNSESQTVLLFTLQHMVICLCFPYFSFLRNPPKLQLTFIMFYFQNRVPLRKRAARPICCIGEYQLLLFLQFTVYIMLPESGKLSRVYNGSWFVENDIIKKKPIRGFSKINFRLIGKFA